MKRDLRSRLNNLKQIKKNTESMDSLRQINDQDEISEPIDRKKEFSSISLLNFDLKEWTEIKPYVWFREKEVNLNESTEIEPIGMSSVDKKETCELRGDDQIFNLLKPQNCNSIDFRNKDLIFYDTETTGLSGGAGNIPFLTGFGRLKNNKFYIGQIFLADYPGEKSKLEILREYLPQEKLFVSYNGRSFDRHLLESRFLMHQIDFQFPYQLDLLYWSRRLWRSRLESCSLSSIEENILGISRTDDIPGFEVPEAYFQFLKTGDLTDIKRIIEHNFQDILSLVFLLQKITRLIGYPGDYPEEDFFSIGRFFFSIGAPESVIYLESSRKRGNVKAFKLLVCIYKRTNQSERLLSLLREAQEKCYLYYFFCEESKYYEHQKKDYIKSLACLDRYLEKVKNPDIIVLNEIEYRKKRVLKKNERRIKKD